MTIDRVMLLIDADNVSVDVMEQAVRLLLNQHGALHVRRAYCTAESAVANQAAFKRLGIKPMVNLAAGKNSTDIAMAVDAIDLVLAERPDVVVIASSDSDFAPLVQRLREKGCVVRGIGQLGKTGDETQDVYDDFTVLEHRKSAASAAAADKPKRGTRRTAASKTTASKPAAAKKVAAKAASKTTRARTPAAARTVAQEVPATAVDTTPAPDADTAAAPPAAAEAAPPAKPAARKTPARKKAAVSPPPPPPPSAPAPAPADDADDDLPGAVVAMLEARAPAVEARGRDEGRGARGPSSLAAVLACLPELEAGQSLALNVAVQRLRAAQLLGKSSSSLKLFSQLSDRFELLPPDKPAQVRLRR